MKTTPQDRGFALVIVLIAVVLLTGLVLAFFSRALLDRQISNSGTNLVKVDYMARSGLDTVVGELRDEIADPTRSTVSVTNDVPVYTPGQAAYAEPQPMGVSSATGPLVKVSASGVGIRPGGTLVGSTVGIDAVSQNGRSISSSRWFTSTTSSPQLGSQPAMPTWLFFTRSDGIKTPTLANAMDATSNDYVIGRFAYTVYDIGALLDANVAGYPSAAASDAAFKPSAAFADLTAIGLSSTAIANFVAWRNASTGGAGGTGSENLFSQWADGLPQPAGSATEAAALAVARSGHLSIASGDNAVLSRHDLLNNPNVNSAAALLTHFSRAVNAPSYAPSTPTTTNPSLINVRFTAAGSITHYADDGTTSTYAVTNGTPLLQRRFSLAKLAWVTSKGPSASLATTDALYNAGGTAAAILSCFGLAWDSANYQWVYQDEDSSSAIKTLSEMAGEGREPTFFELLKAAILTTSVGAVGPAQSMADVTQNALDASTDLQILRIGANIIDCASTDNCPTALALPVGTINVPVYGVKDLPYLYAVGSSLVSNKTVTGSSGNVDTQWNLNWGAAVLDPVLFNPHATSSPAGGQPLSIRCRILSGTATSLTVSGVTGLDVTFTPPASDLTTQTPIEFTISPTAFRNKVAPISNTSDTTVSTGTLLGAAIPSINPNDAVYYGFPLYIYPNNTAFQFVNGTTGTAMVGTISNLLFVLEYKDPWTSTYHVYDTFALSSGFTSQTGLGGARTLRFGPGLNAYPTTGSGSVPVGGSKLNNGLGYCMFKLDPRTNRFGVALSTDFPTSAKAPVPDTPNNVAGLQSFLAFTTASLASPGTFPGLWAAGDENDWGNSRSPTSANTNYHDPDLVVRPADGWLDTANANPMLNLTSATLRPVILQRPYRSVGELGYVFRDSPWKTLSFFDGTSGDSPLLDLFSVTDEPAVVAGQVSLSSSVPQVHQALFSNTANFVPSVDSSVIGNASAMATALHTYLFSSPGTLLANPDGLAGLMSNSLFASGGTTGLDAVKAHREAVVRSLASSTQTRTWNLLIDVVAQAGHYPGTASSLNNFVVEGERRYWLSIAIDRYTGKIVDQQLEPENE